MNPVDEVMRALDNLVRAEKGPLCRDFRYTGLDHLSGQYLGRSKGLVAICGLTDPIQPDGTDGGTRIVTDGARPGPGRDPLGDPECRYLNR